MTTSHLNGAMFQANEGMVPIRLRLALRKTSRSTSPGRKVKSQRSRLIQPTRLLPRKLLPRQAQPKSRRHRHQLPKPLLQQARRHR